MLLNGHFDSNISITSLKARYNEFEETSGECFLFGYLKQSGEQRSDNSFALKIENEMLRN